MKIEINSAIFLSIDVKMCVHFNKINTEKFNVLLFKLNYAFIVSRKLLLLVVIINVHKMFIFHFKKPLACVLRLIAIIISVSMKRYHY